MQAASKGLARQSNGERISRLSGALRHLFLVLAWLGPVFPAVFWLSYNRLPETLKTLVVSGSAVVFPAELPWDVRLVALGGALPSMVITVLGLRWLARLFGFYARRIYFQEENTRIFSRLGWLAVASVFADVVAKTALVLAATMHNPPGQRMLAISFSSDHLKLLLVAGVLTIIGMVMEEGRRINDEHQLTV